ncbi:MAG: cysteine hydrolase [Alphaproteobacteria bacterium]|nr:cysteine hydrolase [Alphaproteobacteria bacterium]PHY00682.1 MAG: isochorismatase [Rhodospirillaceae bacterium]
MTAYINEFSLKFTLRSATTALLVVDMQNATGSLQHGLAKMLHEQGRLEESRYRFERIQNFVVPNIQKLLAAFRALGAPVIFITYGAETPDCSDVARHIRAFVQATCNKVGKAEHDIVDALKPLPQEPVLNKTTMGAFGSTGIDARLRALGVTELVVVGVSTNNCVGMTAMEAADKGYGVVLVSDATGTCSDRMQQAYEEMFLRLWGRVLSTSETIAEIKAENAAKAAE